MPMHELQLVIYIHYMRIIQLAPALSSTCIVGEGYSLTPALVAKREIPWKVIPDQSRQGGGPGASWPLDDSPQGNAENLVIPA